MIVVLVTYQVQPEEREEFVAARRAQVERTQSEDGCMEYRMSLDGFDPAVVVLTERWRDADALAAHLKVVEANKAASTTPMKPALAQKATVFDAEVLRETGT